jgi:hypothetical protein
VLRFVARRYGALTQTRGRKPGAGVAAQKIILRGGVRIMRIRRKIEIDPTKPAVIRTIRGGGYLFSPTGDKA